MICVDSLTVSLVTEVVKLFISNVFLCTDALLFYSFRQDKRPIKPWVFIVFMTTTIDSRFFRYISFLRQCLVKLKFCYSYDLALIWYFRRSHLFFSVDSNGSMHHICMNYDAKTVVLLSTKHFWELHAMQIQSSLFNCSFLSNF